MYSRTLLQERKPNWATQNLRLVRMRPGGRGLDIAALVLKFKCSLSQNKRYRRQMH